MSAALPRCRSCDQDSLVPVLSLGRTPLANSLLKADELARPEPTYPLELAFCRCCTLVQITETVPPEILFRDYLYFSSFSDTMLQHAEVLARDLIGRRRLHGGSLVIEAASNDGYLLQHYHKAGVRVLGIEPARNIARLARERHGIPTLEEFFGANLGQRLADEGRRADVFHAHNVLAHVANLNGFVAGIRSVLKDDGIAVIEAPYVIELVDHCEFDTIYHEHLCYFSLTALARLFARHDLTVCDVERLAIHGGSLRLFVSPTSGKPTVEARVAQWLEMEAAWGVGDVTTYAAFAGRVAALKSKLRGLLGDLKRAGRRIAAYGASAKGSTLLNYCGIGRETLDFVVDRSTVKRGRYTPGTHLAILPPDELLLQMPDYVLLLTWNFADEIVRQQAEYRRRGGTFIQPLPELKVA